MIIGASVFQTMGRLGSIEGNSSAFTRQDFVAAAKKVLDLGYEQIELPADHLLIALCPTELEKLMEDLVVLGQERQTKWSVHLPFLWIDGASLDKNICEASTRTHLDFINLTKILEPTHYVLHSITKTSMLRNDNIPPTLKTKLQNRIINAAKQTAWTLIEAIGDSSKLSLENLTNVDFSWDLEIVKELGASICLDVGHWFHRGGDPIDFLEQHFPYIKSIHAHDIVPTISKADAKNWVLVDHAALGTGIIDNAKIIQWLVENEFTGSYIAEVRGGLEEGCKSMEFIKNSLG